MAETIIKRVYTQQKFYKTPQESAGFVDRRDALMQKYGQPVEQAVRLANIPMLVFQSLLMVENATADPNKVSTANAVGLGQVTAATAIDTIWRENNKKRLTPAEIAILRRQLGNRIDLFTTDAAPELAGIQKMTLGGFFTNPKTKVSAQIKNLVTNDDLRNPEFNLMISAMLLSQIIDGEIDITASGNLVRLDRVIVRYNVSYFTQFNRLSSTDTIIKTAPKESADYIKKMVGTHGMMSVLYS
jgi:hypothetical protein